MKKRIRIANPIYSRDRSPTKFQIYDSDRNSFYESNKKNKNVPYVTLSSNNESSDLRPPGSDVVESRNLDALGIDAKFLTAE